MEVTDMSIRLIGSITTGLTLFGALMAVSENRRHIKSGLRAGLRAFSRSKRDDDDDDDDSYDEPAPSNDLAEAAARRYVAAREAEKSNRRHLSDRHSVLVLARQQAMAELMDIHREHESVVAAIAYGDEQAEQRQAEEPKLEQVLSLLEGFDSPDAIIAALTPGLREVDPDFDEE
jgi:hypothetical protein